MNSQNKTDVPVVLSFQAGGFTFPDKKGEGGIAIAMLVHNGRSENLVTAQFGTSCLHASPSATGLFWDLVTGLNMAAFKHQAERNTYEALHKRFEQDPLNALSKLPASNPYAIYQRRRAEAVLLRTYVESLKPDSTIKDLVCDLYSNGLLMNLRTMSNQSYSVVWPLMTLFRLQDITESLVSGLGFQEPTSTES